MQFQNKMEQYGRKVSANASLNHFLLIFSITSTNITTGSYGSEPQLNYDNSVTH
jgi:hypothetical protein